MSDVKATAGVRLWAFRHVFLLYFTKPSVLEVNERRCEVRIPLNWRTRNHLQSMYFGALCIGADVAGGLICFHLMSAMIRAASSAFIRNGILNRFLSVIGVTTNPGLMVVTPTPYCSRSTRLASRNDCMAALVAE